MKEKEKSDESGKVYLALREETDKFVENINRILRNSDTFGMIEVSIIGGKPHVSKIRLDTKHDK